MGRDSDALRRAARRLSHLWSTGEHIDELPMDERPLTLDDGWAIQRLLDGVAGRRIGWKIASTSAGSQALLSIDHPLMGAMYSSQLVASGSTVAVTRLPFAEAEVAVTMSGDMELSRAPFSRSDLLRHIGSVHAGMEMPSLRVGSISANTAPMVTADFTAAGHYVLGPPLDVDPNRLMDLSALVWRNGLLEATGDGRGALGDPVIALTWLANAAATRGERLADGDVVTTGACASIGNVVAGDRVGVSIGDGGLLELHIED